MPQRTMDNRLFPCLLVSVAVLSSAARVPCMAKDDNRTLPGPWPTYNNAYDGRRFSQARSITPENVGTLKRVCEARLGDPGSFHSGLIVVEDTLYVTTPHTTVALDPANCSIRWRHVYKPAQKEVYSVNRGVAYLDGRIFRGTSDGRILALDARTGEQLWLIKVGDPLKGEFFSSAPIAWRGLVFIGAAGGDWGIRGYVLALDAKTGCEKWRFYTIPMGKDPGADSWKRPETAAHGGAATWTSYTLDTTTGELFVPAGNPAPNYAPDSRPGANLYTDSVVVLDALTGRLKWYHQFKSNDGLDYDFGATPALYTNRKGDKLLAAGSKDGYLYGVDRATHRVVFKTPVTTIKNADARPTPAGVLVCPGPLGGVEWNGPAVNPVSRVIYVGSVDWCFTIKSGTPEYNAGELYFGTAGTPGGEGAAAPSGWIHAVDGNTGNILWKYPVDAPVVAGVTPTAGGVVFSGDLNGNLFALDASNGKELYKVNTGGAIAGGVITYETGGQQYVATTSGNVSRATFNVSRGVPTITGSPKVVVLTTGLSKDEPQIVAVAEDKPLPGAPGEHGKTVFAQYCSACHGATGEGGLGPSLKAESAKKSLNEVTAFIKSPKEPMPKLYPAPLSDQDVADVAEFVETLK
jgi:PQQ-dependent dehydrogenase (methanol/ethanol family)